jgi:type IV pilus assembly protein PilC
MSAVSFEYRAVDAAGARRAGSVLGRTEKEAYRQLTAMGLTPLSIRQAGGRNPRASTIGLRQLVQFTGQLSVLVSAKISISEGLYSISEAETDPKVKALVKDISQRVASGETIADTLLHHPRVFDSIYVETVRAAEKSGNLPAALEFLADMLERQEETRRQIKAAMIYPACVLVALGLAVIFLLTFVVPKFATMFKDRGVPLPMLTTALQEFGWSIQSYWYIYLAVIAGALFALRAAWANTLGRKRIDLLVHKVPVLRRVLVGLAVQRFTQVLGVSIHSGLGLIESLELAGRSAGRPTLMTDVDKLVTHVRTGGRLAECLPRCTYLTPFARRMLIAGESAAELPRMCGVVTRHYERETSHLTKNLSIIIEPILILLITGVVLIVALAIFMPMWSMVELLG